MMKRRFSAWAAEAPRSTAAMVLAAITERMIPPLGALVVTDPEPVQSRGCDRVVKLSLRGAIQTVATWRCGGVLQGHLGTLTPCASSTIVRAMTGRNHICGICREIIR